MRLLLALTLALAATADATDTVRTEAAGLRLTLPRAWRRVPAVPDTRAAQYEVPRAEGETAETDFAINFVGEGKGGSAPESLERWYGRFTQPDGRPSREMAVVTTRTVNGLKVTAIDLAGTYVAAGTGPPLGVSGFRMLGAVVEGPGGPWFIEMLGPARTVGAAKADFDALTGALDPHR